MAVAVKRMDEWKEKCKGVVDTLCEAVTGDGYIDGEDERVDPVLMLLMFIVELVEADGTETRKRGANDMQEA